ncbi:hypothetical protein CEXT_758401 [Caerostris extrusa]|uniref:Uncharacterized protein n=1 Tax=Caerostris extrusa TaxID=172846 RepID=A0AAV4N502_CAEEX|nr:hypothetical protein CEXT_758401 [Caerostris extrusa]
MKHIIVPTKILALRFFVYGVKSRPIFMQPFKKNTNGNKLRSERFRVNIFPAKSVSEDEGKENAHDKNAFWRSATVHTEENFDESISAANQCQRPLAF